MFLKYGLIFKRLNHNENRSYSKFFNLKLLATCAKQGKQDIFKPITNEKIQTIFIPNATLKLRTTLNSYIVRFS